MAQDKIVPITYIYYIEKYQVFYYYLQCKMIRDLYNYFEKLLPSNIHRI